MIVAVPPPTAVTRPELDTDATDLSVVVHEIVLLEASVGETVAKSCSVSPLIRESSVLESDTPVTGTRTVTLQTALWLPSAVVTVTSAAPAAFAVTKPELETVTTELLEEDHDTDLLEADDGATVAVSCCVWPLIIVAVVGETETPLAGVVTVTVQVAFLPPSVVVAVIVAVPLAFAVTRPEELTVATALLLLLQE